MLCGPSVETIILSSYIHHSGKLGVTHWELEYRLDEITGYLDNELSSMEDCGSNFSRLPGSPRRFPGGQKNFRPVPGRLRGLYLLERETECSETATTAESVGTGLLTAHRTASKDSKDTKAKGTKVEDIKAGTNRVEMEEILVAGMDREVVVGESGSGGPTVVRRYGVDTVVSVLAAVHRGNRRFP